MGVGRWDRGALASLDFEIFSNKMVIFLVLSGKKKFHHSWSPLEKILPTPMNTGRRCYGHICVKIGISLSLR